MAYAGPATGSKPLPQAASARAADSLVPKGAPRQGAPRQSLPAARPARPARATVFAAGMALGIAVGAMAGLLLAPQAGEDTRRALARRGRTLRRRGRDAWDDLAYELDRIRRHHRRRRDRATRAP